MRRRRRWEDEQLDERERPAKPRLAQLDEGTRAGVLEQLQRAGGNTALQRVVGPQLQRDTTTAETPAKRSVGSGSVGTWVLAIDGTVVGPVAAVSGGGARTQVIQQPATGGGVSGKHITGVQYEPVTFKVGLGMAKGFFEWINATAGDKHTSKTLTLHQVDASGNEKAQLELNDVWLSRVELPQLSADDTSPAFLTVTAAPERAERKAGSGQKLDTKLGSDPLVPSTVRFEISGIGQVADLKSIAGWFLDLKIEESYVGQSRYPTKHATSRKLGNLVLSLAETGKGSSAKFDDWFDDFVVKGNSRDERTATLTVSSKGGRKLELTFSGVGIVAVEHFAGADGGRRYELYVEDVRFATP